MPGILPPVLPEVGHVRDLGFEEGDGLGHLHPYFTFAQDHGVGRIAQLLIGYATYLHDLFACAVFAIMTIVDEAAEHRLRKAGANEVFHAPRIEPLFQRVREHLETLTFASR